MLTVASEESDEDGMPSFDLQFKRMATNSRRFTTKQVKNLFPNIAMKKEILNTRIIKTEKSKKLVAEFSKFGK